LIGEPLRSAVAEILPDIACSLHGAPSTIAALAKMPAQGCLLAASHCALNGRFGIVPRANTSFTTSLIEKVASSHKTAILLNAIEAGMKG